LNCFYFIDYQVKTNIQLSTYLSGYRCFHKYW